MFWALITAVFAGFFGAGIALVLRQLTGKRLPKGIVPVGAGLGMIVATIGLEYGWYDSVRTNLAEDLVVISERKQQAWYQPWTYVEPWVRGFIGFSPAETVETAPGSGILVVQMRRHERWQPEMVLPNLIDCDGARRAEILPETEFDADGQPENVIWREVGGEDPIIAAVCGGEAIGS